MSANMKKQGHLLTLLANCDRPLENINFSTWKKTLMLIMMS
jgi:hypothetical protein